EGSRVRLAEGIEVRLHLATPESFGSVMVRHTGSIAHLARLGSFGDFATEEAVYASLGLPLIPAELREDQGEVEAAQHGTLPRLVEVGDLRGDMHCHTFETDGTASLEDMALAARARGYAYMALTDHSRSLAITNGLSLERLEEARRAVAEVNARLA